MPKREIDREKSIVMRGSLVYRMGKKVSTLQAMQEKLLWGEVGFEW